jgi:hypothetical protein
MHVIFEIVICSCSWHAPHRRSWAAIGVRAISLRIDLSVDRRCRCDGLYDGHWADA